MLHSTKKFIILITLIIFIGLNLRPLLASIGPIVPILEANLLMSNVQISLLTTLPIIMMGIFAFFGPKIQYRFGLTRSIFYGLLLLFFGNAYRFSVDNPYLLIISTMIGGLGIGLIQALIPAFIRHECKNNVEFYLGIFSTCIMGGAAIAAASSAPITESLDYNLSLGILSIPVAITCIIWLMYKKVELSIQHNLINKLKLSATHWLLMIFFGVGTGAYTLVLAWLPPYYIHLGWSANDAGYALAVLTLAEVIIGLLISFLVIHVKNFRFLVIFILITLILGLLLLAFTPHFMPLFTIILLGIGIGGLFPLSLIITFHHVKSPAESVLLLAFVQGGGYLIAAFFPLLAGYIREISSSLSDAWLIMAIFITGLIIISYKITDNTYHEI